MARRIDRLTDKTVKAQKAKGLHADGDGLFLRVTKTKTGVNKGWVFRFKRDGKARDMGLGGYPAVSLAEARRKAKEAREQRDRGEDPIEERDAKARRKRAEKTRLVTFEKAAEAYMEDNKEGWKNAKHRQQWKNTLEAYVYPIIGDLPVPQIGVAHVREVLKAIWKKKPETASRVRGRIEAVIRAARSDDDGLWSNPARWERHKDHFAKRPKARKHPALPYQDVPAFLARLRAKRGSTARALEVTILTALRTSEVIGARFDELDFAAKVWSVPPERMKGRVEGDDPFRVPLCDRVIAIVKEMEAARLGDFDVFVFPGINRRQPLSQMAMRMLVQDMQPGITVHGFRSSFRDWASEQTSAAHDVCEYSLSHMPSDEVVNSYKRTDLLEKRRPLMEQWAKHCGLRAQPTKPAKAKETAAEARSVTAG